MKDVALHHAWRSYTIERPYETHHIVLGCMKTSRGCHRRPSWKGTTSMQSPLPQMVLAELNNVHGYDEYPLSVFQLCRILEPLLPQ